MDAVLRLVEAGTGVAVVPDLVFAGRPRLRRTALTPAAVPDGRAGPARGPHPDPGDAGVLRHPAVTSSPSSRRVGGSAGDVQVLRRPEALTPAPAAAPD